MIPEIFKLNKFVYTRIPRPYELFKLTGFKAVNNGSMYSDDIDNKLREEHKQEEVFY